MSTPREQRLADTFVQLSDTLVDDFDLVDFFQTLTERCVELLDVAAAGLLLSRPTDDALHVCAWTPGTTRTVQLFSTAATGSPALHSFRTGEAVAALSLHTDDAHADFTHEARQAGYTHAFALPLRLRDQLLGSLLLLGTTPQPPDGAELRLAQALADQAAIGLVHQRTLVTETTTNAQLRTALHSRITVEQAKGFLSVRLGTDLDDAYEAMRSYARAHRRRLTAVATDVLDNGLRPVPPHAAT